MPCRICSREEKAEGFCRFHLKAYRNLRDKFGLWKNACAISWKEYLREIAENSLSGEWVKEVAEYLMINGEDQNASNG
jgi:hypothetical protein